MVKRKIERKSKILKSSHYKTYPLHVRKRKI